MSNFRTSSRCDSASSSTCRTPSTMPSTSASVRRVTRQGAQKAEENCSNVARSPSSTPTSAAETLSTSLSFPRKRPSIQVLSTLSTTPATSAPASTHSPRLTTNQSTSVDFQLQRSFHSVDTWLVVGARAQPLGLAAALLVVEPAPDRALAG